MAYPEPQNRRNIDNQYKLATRGAFSFVKYRNAYNKLNQYRTTWINKVGGELDPTWIFMSIFVVIAAVGMAIFGAANSENIIEAIIDPNNIIKSRSITTLLIGASISIIGMMIGHLIHYGFQREVSIDPLSGEEIVNTHYSHATLGIIFGLVYIGTQFTLATLAGSEPMSGSSAVDILSNSAFQEPITTNRHWYESLSNSSILISAIALFEIIIGCMFMYKAFVYALLGITYPRLQYLEYSMNRSGAQAYDYYNEYDILINAYNHTFPQSKITQQITPFILQVITHRTGEDIPERSQTNSVQDNNNLSPSAPQTPDNNGRVKQTITPMENNGPAPSVSEESDISGNLQEFLNDRTNDDLTV